MEESFCIPVADDMHCHLRQGDMLKFTVDAIKKGGCNRVLVMPNTTPIISTCEEAKNYRKELMKYEDSVDFLMTLYLNKKTDENDILKNYRECNFQGIKIYPSNVTTNSDEGITQLEPYYKIFDTLEKLNKSLHIHCEEPNINPLYGEKYYLNHIHELAIKFPHLKIVVEHISTEDMINVIKQYPNLAGSITPHHLYLTIDDVIDTENFDYSVDNISIEKYVKNVYNYCKPLAKTVDDKIALRKIIQEDFPRIFLGSDSAPHFKNFKNEPHYKPGIFTQPYLLSYLAHIFNKFDSLDKIKNFACTNASQFLNLKEKNTTHGEHFLYIEKKICKIPDEYFGVVPFLAGEELAFTVSYK
ncbi:dihydroorotase, putative [Plasmodium ovale wallikeri]|uniref:dihydroorotase n=2 Tax=Plasmodium ovale TaxID=36330 RepID=A0A1A8ZCR9_PLAOA|nr:dihydroorotase, putative [Plasmodium ovale wallikeri]SBT42025.1 dihydroorotase, putative [Plasmodium ovale wallikeri]SBT78215.1 dihydroorotase, putative [Plasmodium ovale]